MLDRVRIFYATAITGGRGRVLRLDRGERSWLVRVAELQLKVAGSMQHPHEPQNNGILEANDHVAPWWNAVDPPLAIRCENNGQNAQASWFDSADLCRSLRP